MSWRSFKKVFPEPAIVLLAFIALYAVFRLLGITCPIYAWTGVPCPTCFMSRAFFALLRGDFAQYSRYNVMAFPTAAVFVCELFGALFGKYRKYLHGCCAVVLTVNLLYYLLRLAGVLAF